MKNEYKILIIEDDMLLNDMTKRLLTQHGYCATSAYSGSEALLLIERSSFDLILLDLMLPGISGEIVLEKIKNIIDIPIIGVSAKTDIDSKVNLIRNGADDYITKPFRLKELLVRIKSVFRRYNNDSGDGKIKVKDLVVNTNEAKVYKNGNEIVLTAMEYRLLLILLNNRGCVLSRTQLLENIWDVAGDFVEDNTLTVYIKRLRDKIEENPTEPEYIKTIRGLGYIIENE